MVLTIIQHKELVAALLGNEPSKTLEPEVEGEKILCSAKEAVLEDTV